MSCYVCDDKTISVIAEGFKRYGVDYVADNYHPTNLEICLVNEGVKAIAQSLLDQNYASVNARYSEDTPTPRINYTPMGYLDFGCNDLGLLLGCIRNYEYQACETDDYFESDIHYSLRNLKDKITEVAIKKLGYEIPWGYGSKTTL